MQRSEAELTRRSLLMGGAAGAIALGWSSVALGRGARREVRLGTALGAGLIGKGESEENVFSYLNLDDPAARQTRIPLEFYGHGMAADPLDPYRIALFEKAGKGACILDLNAGEVVRPIHTSAEREFYGHGAFSPDGKLLYATESMVEKGYRGVVVVRDAQTLDELGEFPSFGEAPHDCVLRDGGATLVVTNGGGRKAQAGSPPSVSYVDVSSEKLIERILIEDPDIGAGHLALTSRGDLAVVSAARLGKTRDGVGAVSLRPYGGDFETLSDPREITARMRGETLSVAIHEPSRVVGVTNPFGGLVTFWDIERASFVSALELSYPRGIALSLDGSRFVISYGRSTSLLEVDAETLEPLKGSRRSSLDMQSSHIVVHELP